MKKQPAVMTSVGVQTELSHASIPTQTQWLCKDESSQTSPSSTSVSVQVDSPSPSPILKVAQAGLARSGDIGAVSETKQTPLESDSRGMNEDEAPNFLIVGP